MFPAFHVDHSRVAVGFTGVVDEPRSIAMHRCVHHIKVINTKHVATDSLRKKKASTLINVRAKKKDFNRIYIHTCTYIYIYIYYHLLSILVALLIF